MPYTLGQAAKATGKNKATIFQAIKSGKLSAIKDDLGRYAIDPAELHRLYPPVSSGVEDSEAARREQTLENAHETAMLRLKVEFLERLNAQLQGENETLKRLLPQPSEPPAVSEPAPAANRGIFGWWKGRAA